MTKKTTTLYECAEHLKDEIDISLYLEAALEEGDTQTIQVALGNIAKARGMSQIAKETGLRRESLYKALAPSGNPEFSTILKVIRTFCIK